jgi:RHS repeat-associated protein
VITDSAGNIKAESDYRPFGAEVQFTNNDGNDYKFTGQKRDTESGLDFFGARYYSNAYGRFVTPDWSAGPATVPYANLDNPQTLNLYRYVPVTGIDPDGHRFESIVGEGGGWGLDTLVVGARLLSTQDLIDKLLAQSKLPGELPRLTPDPTQIDPDGPCYTEEALARMKGTAPSMGAAHRGEVYSYGAVWMSAFAMYNQANNGLNGATAFIDYCDVPSPTSEDFKGGEEPHMELGNQLYTRTNLAKNDPQYVDLNKGAEDSQVGSGYVGLSAIPVAAAMNEEVTACANKRYATPANHPWVPGPGPAVWSNPFKESPYPQK